MGGNMRLAMIGTRGVPAKYGGFETAVEELGQRLVARGHEVVVFCREPGAEEHLGMRRVVLPALRRRSLETLSHAALSVLHPTLVGVDAAIVFNAANSILLPVLRARGIPVATHVDGLEWLRPKWGQVGSRYYRLAERLAVRWSDELIADAGGIADYYRKEFDARTRLLCYGAPALEAVTSDRLDDLGLTSRGYHLVVARFEPENHVKEIVEGYVASSASRPLVVVGSAPYSNHYTAAIKGAADERVRLLGGVWDQELLDQLYGNALTYLHGHSVGGTNPSLLRAAGAAAPVIAFDVAFNQEVCGRHADYFATPEDLPSMILASESDPRRALSRGAALRSVAIDRYCWERVADGYEQMCVEMVAQGPKLRRDRPSGRRLTPPGELVEAGNLAPLTEAGWGDQALAMPSTPVDELEQLAEFARSGELAPLEEFSHPGELEHSGELTPTGAKAR